MTRADAMIAPAPPDWVGTLYDDLIADMMLRRDDVGLDVDFLIRTLGLRPGMRVLDQGCGVGALAIPLARRGMDVTGVDQATGYIAEARAAAAHAGVTARFDCADAAGHVPPMPVHGAFNWWTSWGHADEDAGNLALLRAAHDALLPNGMFAIDTMNVCGVLHGFIADTAFDRDVPHRGGRVTLRRTSRIDAAAGLLHKLWTYTLPDGRRVDRASSMRLYMPWQVAAMLAAAGFTDIRLTGSMAGEPLAVDSPRLIAVARRPS